MLPLLFDRVVRSGRLRELSELEEAECCIAADAGCVARAREERRGFMAVGACKTQVLMGAYRCREVS